MRLQLGGNQLHDYGEHLPKPDTAFQEQITEVVDRLLKARVEVESAEADLKASKKKLEDIEQRELPELMEGMGLTEFRCSNGLKVKLKEDCKVSIPAAERARAYAWMDEHGFGDLVKRAFQIRFGRDDREAAEMFAEELAAKTHLDVEQKHEIHSATLKKFARERLAEGDELPSELFNVFEFYKIQVDT